MSNAIYTEPWWSKHNLGLVHQFKWQTKAQFNLILNNSFLLHQTLFSASHRCIELKI